MKREKALRGEAVSKNCAYGYMLDENRSMVVDPEAAETVRLIFEMYAGNRSVAGIAQKLYEDGRPTPAARKKYMRKDAGDAELQCVWQKPVILGMLRDEQYTGVYVAGKTKTVEVNDLCRVQVPEDEWIIIPGHHPAIVSRELFDAVQNRFRVKGEPLRRRNTSTTQRYPASAPSPLKGKVICGCCGHAMRISSTKNAAFHCHFTLPAPDAGCHRLRILKSELEGVVMASVKRQAKAVKESGYLAAGSHAEHIPAIVEYEGRIEKLREEQQRLYESFVLGGICRDDYKMQKSAVDSEIEKTRLTLESIRGQSGDSASDAIAVEAAKKALRKRVLSKELVDMLIDRVLVYPDDRIEIVWKLPGFMDCLPQREAPCVTI
ncbi:MAG: recombinase family protein [Syntrophomonadaceae bacterium]|nr:recombinase family protein [Syntrophomonadaceae bacterium]